MTEPAELKFWMVWREGSMSMVVQHSSHKCALKEAERLAKNNPGKVFFVMSATAAVVADHPKARQLKLRYRTRGELIDDEIPF